MILVISAIYLQLLLQMELDKQIKQKGFGRKKTKDFTTVKRSFLHIPIVEGKSSKGFIAKYSVCARECTREKKNKQYIHIDMNFVVCIITLNLVGQL